MSMLEKLRAASANLAPAHISVKEWTASSAPIEFGTRMRPAVEPSEDLTRILTLPRRPVVDLGYTSDIERGDRRGPSARALALVQLMTERLTRGARACACPPGRCITRLLPAQAWALWESSQVQGLLGPIGVGHGKTGLDILTPMVMPECKRAVLLIPPGLRVQLLDAYTLWREHFNVPSLVIDNKSHIIPGRPVLHVVPYSKFSRHESSDLLRQLAPDLIIADEAHRLRYPDTATTGRVLRYFAEHDECRFCGWSGTLTAKSIKDYAHLSAIALRHSSPVPLHPATVEEWACALDPSDWPAPPGELRRLCADGETLYQGFHRRLVETKGVVSTRASAIEAEINIVERKAPPMPVKLEKMLEQLRGAWVRPDGEELIDVLEVARNARELACGFFYRWKFPRGEPEELILEWFAARKAYHKELREKLKRREEYLDSPLLCAQAAVRFIQEQETGRHRSKGGHSDGKAPLPVWDSEYWPAWCAIKDRVYHESEAVWVDDYLARDCAEWGLKNKGIIWYEHEAFGRRVSELSGLNMHGGGPGAEARILAETGKKSIIASIKSHGTGRDGLQRIFSRQLVPNPPSSGDLWEQLLGRLHRIGQAADEVDTEIYRHTDEMRDAIDRALIQARYIEGTMGTWQKLLTANLTFSLAGR